MQSPPADFASHRPHRLQGVGEKKPRAAFLTDPIGRYLYVLYFPKVVKADQLVALDFHERRLGFARFPTAPASLAQLPPLAVN